MRKNKTVIFEREAARLFQEDLSLDRRREALQLLGKLGSRFEARLRPLFLRCLERPEWPLRSAAAESLGRLPASAESAPALLQAALRDEIPWSRSAAFWALSQFPSKQLKGLETPLREALKHPDQERQARALRLAARLPRGSCHTGLFYEHSKAPVWRLRAAALTAIGRLSLGAMEDRRCLERGLEDEDPSTREAAAEALASFKPPELLYERALKDSEPPVRVAALMSLAAQPESNSPRLVQIAQEALKSEDSRLRSHAAGLLGGLGVLARPALPGLIQQLNDLAPNVYQVAFDALQSLGEEDQEALRSLWAALDLPDPQTRTRALMILERLDSEAPDQEAALLKLLKDPSRRVWKAAEWLAQRLPIRSAEALHQLYSTATHPSPHIRQRAISVMKQSPLAPGGADALLKRSLGDPSDSVRCASVEWVGALGGEARGALPTFVRRLYEGDQRVERLAGRVYKQIRSKLPSWLRPESLNHQALQGLVLEQGALLSPAAAERLLERAQGHANWYADRMVESSLSRNLPIPPRPLLEGLDLEMAMRASVQGAEQLAILRRSACRSIDEAAERGRIRERVWLLAQIIDLNLSHP